MSKDTRLENQQRRNLRYQQRVAQNQVHTHKDANKLFKWNI
jgi:hypothetical protein